MKTSIFSTALCMIALIIPLNTSAQFTPGIHGALNLETQAELGQLWNNCELYQGYMFGGTLGYELGKNLSLQTELNFQKKGEKISEMIEGSDAVIRREFNYLTVPLLLKETLRDAGLGNRWNVSFFGGPYASYLVSARSRMTIGSSTNSENIDSEAEKSDFGAMLGGELSYRLSNGSAITVDLRYQMGLSKIDKNDPDLRNKGMGLTIGYRF